MKTQLAKHHETMNQKLQGFQRMYQDYASGLLSKDSPVVPPGHPLFTSKNSVQILKTQNDKLVKENLELRKKLQSRPSDRHNP